MTAGRRTLLAAAIVVIIGSGIFEIGFLLPRKRELEALQLRADHRLAELRQANRENADAVRAVRPVQEEIARLSAPTQTEFDAELSAWLARVVHLRELAAQHPEQTIPEFELLTEKDWFDAARDAEFDPKDDNLSAQLLDLRDRARMRLAPRLRRALIRFADAHHGQLPDEVSQLAPFLTSPLNPAILGRYEMSQRGRFADVPKEGWLIDETTSFDEETDHRLYLSHSNAGTTPFTEVRQPDFRAALQAYLAANRDQLPPSPAELLPFFSRELAPTTRKAFLETAPEEFNPEALKKLLPAE
jgi:hypothetical protein